MKFKITFLYVLSLIAFQCIAQNTLLPNQQKISNSVADYFKLDRENIHLHLNKTIYLTSEEIWFKGYIIEKKHKTTQNTSNVYVSLHDSDGQKIATQLYYSDGKTFEGQMTLGKKLLSGRYFLQAYTNFMNNFSEDESSVYEIAILNETEKEFIPQKKANYNSAAISFFPESGIFLEGVANTIGVKISDCNDLGIAIQNGEILDSEGKIVTTFSTDAFGYGKFEIYDTKSESYTAIFTLDGKKKKQPLPIPVATGISFSIDNYIFPDKTVVKLRTNSKTINQIKNTPYTLVFQQNENTLFVDFSFGDTNEHQLIVPSSQLPKGLNSVYLIDNNLNKIAERIIFKPYPMPEKSALEIIGSKTDSIVIQGISPVISGNMSISVLPASTSTEHLAKMIHSDFLFDNYLLKPSKNSAYYLNDFSRKKHYELDNYLLCQQSKYDWNAMMSNAPTAKFNSDKGFTIKGTINSNLKNPKEIMVNMNAIGSDINESTSLNDKNEFFFENVMAQDSTKIYFVAIDQKQHKPEVKIYSQLLNNNRVFNKPLVINTKPCIDVESKNEKIPLPKVSNAILIDSIMVTGKKNSLKHQKQIGNAIAKGFKISDADINRNRDVLQFIGNNGFKVSSLGGKVSIINGHARLETAAKSGTINKSKKSGSAWGSNAYSDTNKNMNGPAIYIDNFFVSNYDVLRDYTMNQIDEIYINRMTNDLSIYGSSGIIKIYTKINPGVTNDQSNTPEAFVIKNGFQRSKPFENPKYDNVQDKGFMQLGTIDWKPMVTTDNNGFFRFSIPNLYQKSIQVIIEGISPEGQMISETQLLKVP